MKSTTIWLLLICSTLAAMPRQSLASAPVPSSQEKAQLMALAQPSLLLQSAGERVIVVERDRGGWYRGRRGIGLGAAILITAIVVSVLVFGVPQRRY